MTAKATMPMSLVRTAALSAMLGIFTACHAGAAPAVTDRSAIGELNYWNAIKNSSDPADLKSYLDAFPDGMFYDPATARYLALTGQKPSPTAVDGETGSVSRTAPAIRAKKAAPSRKSAAVKKQKAAVKKNLTKNAGNKTPTCKSGGVNGCVTASVPPRKRPAADESSGGGGGGSGGGGGWN